MVYEITVGNDGDEVAVIGNASVVEHFLTARERKSGPRPVSLPRGEPTQSYRTPAAASTDRQPIPAGVRFVSAGLWRSGDTLAELAAEIGLPAENLVATVRRFNDLVASGRDADFERGEHAYDRSFSEDAPPLTAIEHGPFHAAAFGFSDLGTKGGLRTDVHARVLDPSGAVIPGLCAAGNTMAAPSGEVYPGGGNPIGTSVLFSHLAAVHITS